ncbi:Hypothetical predicted protein [Paramuricea clavata]|uniref:Uncharacterized protein n=1 Tax=Paramuricea clavata TaxID=317549 RepID=A0A6S7J8M4_PARCT|nr:Hypothetical predicted protein [Paramuricea clavata]
MSITKVSDFTKDSFCFEDAVVNSYGSKIIDLTACDQGPILLKVTDCNTPTLYPGIDDETEMYEPKGNDPIDHRKYQNKRFYVDAIVRIKGIFMSGNTTSIQVKLYEANILKEKPRIPRKRLLRD